MRVAEAYCYDAGASNAARAMREARAAVAELVEAASAAHMALIGYLPPHRNAVTEAAIAKVVSALARCRGGES